MNLRYTLILALVAIALGTFAYTQRDAEPVDVGAGTPTPTAAPLFDLKPEDVQEVAVVGATGSYTLTRVAGGWEIDGEKTNDTVDGVVRNLAAPTVVRDLPADRNPDDYGFSTPTLTVTLKTAGGDSKVLEVGDDTPVDFNVYVREQGGARILILGRADFTSLKDWLVTKPLAPTPTATSDGTAEAAGTPPADGTGMPGPGEITLPPLLGTPGTAPAVDDGGQGVDETPEGEDSGASPAATPEEIAPGGPAPAATATEATS